MEFRQLRHLIALSDHGNYARAAASLGITQPTLSASIAKIEQDLGVRLFERGRFGAVSTAYADALIRRARVALTELRLAELEVESLKGAERGHVVVGVGPFFAHRIVPAAIRRFNKRRPQVEVMTEEGTSVELFEKLATGGFDFVVSTPSSLIDADPELRQEVLFQTTDALVVRSAHPLAGCTSVSAVELAGFPWIVSAKVPAIRQHALAIFAEAGVTMTPTIVRTDAVPIIRHLILEDDYIGIMSSEVGILDVEAGRLSILPYEKLNLNRRGAVTLRKRSALSPVAAQFLGDVKAVCRDLLPGVDRSFR